MTDRVVLLAVTKMLSGFCVGGISLSSGKWIRPVKEFGTILLGDIRYPPAGQDLESRAAGQYMRMFDVVELALLKARPSAPHIEDWIADFVRTRPKLIGRLVSKREAFLERYAEKDAGWLACPKPPRSLALVGPCRIEGFFRRDAYSRKFEARLGIEGGPLYPVTDLKWRALGRTLVPDGGELAFDTPALAEKLGARAMYLSFGLSRLHEGRYWPLVVGVHAVPDYEAQIDYSEP